MTRPEGQPGTAWYGYERIDPYFGWDEEMSTVKQRLGFSYPAVMGETLWIWRDGDWIESPGYERHFEPGPEWQASCDHEHAVPWRTCDTEAECLSLRREDEAKWGDR